MALDVFLAGNDVTLVVPLADASGNPISVDAISYRVLDNTGAEVVAATELVDFIPGDPTASVLVPLALNQLASGTTREIRSVELLCLTAGNTVSIAKAYALESATPLIVGVNSFQTQAVAELTALDIPNISSWHGSSENSKIAALVEARERLLRLNFGCDLSLLTVVEYENLDDRFKRAMRQAQIVEANFILGGDTQAELRQAGVVSDAIGESRQVFRQGKPLELPVCKAALNYLTRYVSFGLRIARG